MPSTTSRLGKTPVVLACLIFLIAVLAFVIPAAARINGVAATATTLPLAPGTGLAAPKLQRVDELAPASPAAPSMSFVVNDAGDAADNSFGNGVCDTSAAPGDQCTLRAAMQEAEAAFGGDTITFNLPSPSTITLNSALPDILSRLTITGPGSSLLTVTRSTAGGTPDFRIFFAVNATTTISGLTITNGKTPDGVSSETVAPGGGISQAGGAMTLTDVVITGNRTGNGGNITSGFSTGFGGQGGGINSTGTLLMTNCVVSNNITGNGGSNTSSGSSSGGWGGFGGGINITGTLAMANSVISNNTTGNGGPGGSGGSGGRGAGIFIGSGTLVLNSVTISANHTGNSGGPSGGNSGYGGGIFSDSSNTSLVMTSVTITNNTTGNNITTGSVGGGAGIYLLGGTATLTDSNVSNNHNGNANPGSFIGGGGSGGGIFNNGNFIIKNSLISGNTTGNGAVGGDGNVGGGISNNFNLTVINSTISGNSTGVGSSRGGGIYSGGTVSLINCTIFGNQANDNLGNGLVGTGPTNLRNTIVARNGANPDSPDLNPGFFSNAFTSQGHNFIGNADGVNGFTNGVNGDQVGTSAAPIDPLLGPLADNGGPTLTHAPLDGSPVVDAGDDCVAAPTHCGDANLPQLTTDQRGPGFNRIVDGPDADTTATVDIGAYEKQALFPDLANTSGNEDTIVVVAFELNDSGSVTSVTATSSNTTLVPNNPANLNLSGSGSLRILTINPVANLSGTSDLTVTVNRTGGSANTTFTLTINPVNDVPSFTKGADQSVNENSGAQTVNNWAANISAGPADEAGQTLAFQVSNNNPSLFSVAPAISAGGTLTYTPSPGASGSAVISVALMDNGGTTNGGSDTSATQTFNLNVLEGGTLQFFSGSFSVFESSGSVNILVTRTGGSAGEARVDYATGGGTATAGVDYTATSGTLIFPDGVTSQSFTVQIITDLIDEPNEVIGLTLTNAAGTGSLGFLSGIGLGITDDDPTPSLRINDVSVTEGDSGTVNAVFTVTLSAVSSFTVSANYVTADGTAIASSSDYQPASGQVVFSPGDLTKFISVTVNGDSVPEVHETFAVNLSSPSSASIADGQGIGTILSDDAPGGAISFNVLHDNINEASGFATIVINRTGNTSAAATVDYATGEGNSSVSPCSVSNDLASNRCDFTTASGTLRFAAGDTSRSFIILINQDNFVEPPEALTITLSNATGGAVLGSAPAGSLTIFDDATEPTANPIDDAEAFVRQHYHDFLNREADPSGLAFWKDQIVSCGADAQCVEIRRINVSAAFYLSIEFQETGYLVERLYKVAYGTALGTSTQGGTHQFPVPVIRLNEFLPDTQEIGRGVVVGDPGWELAIEANKQSFVDRFVQRARFTAANAFPPTLTDSQFVDKLNTNAGGVLLPAERIQLINDLSSGAKTHAQVVRTIAEDSDLAISEKNRAFVLMQYFGYLRRNPNDNPDSNHTGYEFWLNKLNQFGGNFVNAEMVKSFLVAGEYRGRFGQ
ncbi:MAG TPA: Calx-beta domain-containing protein [Pyrinomonadaceae bacterium]|nr:Calx-beta domain-containing protein [Pyrinomonadaceae bacterium]